MVNTSKSTYRPTVALSLPKKVPALVVYAQAIVERMTGNPSFPTPTPALAALIAAIHDLPGAETAALARTKGAAAAAVQHDGGKTWVTAPATLQAKTTVASLVPGSTVQFKYRAVTKTGERDWSQPVSLMVP